MKKKVFTVALATALLVAGTQANAQVEIVMVTVKGGTITLGTEATGGAKQVTISDFQIGKYEVTRKQWKEVMGSLPDIGEPTLTKLSYKNDHPVEAGYDDIQKFLTALNTKTGKNYRLPTEAEWEYAAKGGQSTHNYDYSGSATIDDVAWYRSNTRNKTGTRLRPVGKKAANELGIYDMSGNASEWCSDWYDKTTYPSGTDNPTGAVSGSQRVLRGGNYGAPDRGCHVSYRSSSEPFEIFTEGFRLVLPL